MTYTCKDNAYLQDDSRSLSLTCQGGQMSLSVACEFKCTAGNPGEGFTDINQIMGTLVSVNDPYTIECNTGYVDGEGGVTTKDLICGADGTFPTERPQCVVKCMAPVAPQGYITDIAEEYFDVGQTIQYRCSSQNMVISGSDMNYIESTCTSGGEFSGLTEISQCVSFCLMPATPNTYDTPSPIKEKFQVGENITYTCSDPNGYVPNLNSRSTIGRCLDSGQFEAPPDACVVKCTAPAARESYAPNAAAGQLFNEGHELTYTCASANGYVDGDQTKQTHKMVCGSDGMFPTSNWPACYTLCQAPEAPQGYVDTNQIANKFFRETLNIQYHCEDPKAIVDGTRLNVLQITCQADGSFSPAEFPSCQVKCLPPNPQPGYDSLPLSTLPVAVGGTLTFTCHDESHTVGTTMLRTHEIICSSNATFTTDWPTCRTMCQVPTPTVNLGYTELTNTQPVAVGEKITFTCQEAGALVGMTSSNKRTITCGSNGQFYPTEWESCSTRCVPPPGDLSKGYNSLPAGTQTVAVGENLTYQCLKPTYIAGNSISNRHTVTCGNDGTFSQADWPKCEPRCIIPPADTASGYATYSGPIRSVRVGKTFAFNCSNPLAEVEDSMSNSNEMKCGCDGQFPPQPWPLCGVPKTCSDPPATGGNGTNLVLEAGTPMTIKAHRSVNYVCSDSTQATDEGSVIQLKCLTTGMFETRTSWPECKAVPDCDAVIPNPPHESGLANSTSTVIKVGDKATFACKETGHKVNDGMSEFSITCGAGSSFGTIEWPTCTSPTPMDPMMPMDDMDSKCPTEKKEKCHCLGEIEDDMVSNKIRMDVCRNASRAPTTIRCGVTSLTDIQASNICFCDSPHQQARKNINTKCTSSNPRSLHNVFFQAMSLERRLDF